MSRTPSRGSWRVLLGPGLVTLVAFGFLMGLAVWQLERKSWKDGLVAQIEARARGEPGAIAPEAQWPAWRASDDEFRRVRVSGRFLNELTVPIHGLLPSDRGTPVQGYYLFTPLRQEDGSIVIVNRGFVPTELRGREIRPEGQETGTVSVTGLVRAPEKRGLFVPENKPDREEWFVRDVDDMARARGLARVAPFLVEADATPNPGGWPKGGQTRLTLPNNHLQYAITWFGVAMALLGVFGAWARGRLRDEPA